MKLTTIFASLLSLSLVAYAADIKRDAEASRHKFYEMQLKDQAYHEKIAAQAAKFNQQFSKIAEACDSKQASMETFACLPAAPKAPTKPEVK